MTQVDVVAILATAKEVAAGMAYLHADHILHGDLTAGNILLTASVKDARQFVTKIADFGLSREVMDTSISTGTYGTVTHMPPELLSSGVPPNSPHHTGPYLQRPRHGLQIFATRV